MNTREFNCVKILTEMIENDGLVGIKTSFEDEGASFNDTIRLKELCNQSKTKLTIKIGGPEAIRDIKDSMIIGVKGLVAPMIESDFGVKKFIQASKKHISADTLSTLNLGINIETINSVENIDSILNVPEIDFLYGVTIGRVDLVSSMNKDRNYVNDDQVYKIVKNVFAKAKKKRLKLCLGGAISIDSLQFLKELHEEGLLDKFETRYAIYDPVVALKNLPKSLMMGQLFELEWLKCKYERYSSLSKEDESRIEMIENRMNESKKSVD